MRQQIRTLGASFVVLAMLSACGGGGDETGSGSSSNPQGVYAGTLTGAAGGGNAFRMLVLENNDSWTLYGTESGNTFTVGGFVQGSGSVANGVYTSTDAKDFGYAPALAGTARATFVTNFSGTSVNGSFTPSTGPVAQFNGGPISGFNYNTAAQLSTVAGAWSSGLTLNVNGTSGAFTGSTGTCTFSGNVSPRPTGKNVFNVTMNFGALCQGVASQATSGVAVAYPVTVGSTTYTQLLVGVVNSGRTAGAWFASIR
jgi:hypothetical protein